ncbi:unnamed protein product [Pseudo-nitzschia multistriata]|uniref:Photosystem II Psb31 protein domain-containing protein n=1 Tax=Pseudo-nitzschia multistriata TaxID=183589 RepID=A0A448Z4V1_9STRA|nr:unnamed protein product [Pseudo-nitzschia multistriata]
MPSLTMIASLTACLSLLVIQAYAFQEASNAAIFSSRSQLGSIYTHVSLHESSQPFDSQERNLQERRSFLSKLALIPAVVLPSLATLPTSAQASGGATAGGAYLLSAKKRYYERVKESVTGLLKAEDGLRNGDSKVAKEYFSSEDGGSWKDLTAAGYLLSNAFRRSSSTAPDSLPAVKKYKAFAKEVEAFQKTLKKKGAAAASEAFPTVEAALDEWLSEIELPAAREL